MFALDVRITTEELNTQNFISFVNNKIRIQKQDQRRNLTLENWTLDLFICTELN